MAATLIPGPRTWKADDDDEGYRVYRVTWLVKTDDPSDGPAVVLACPNLPAAGTVWNFNFGAEFDLQACRLPSQSCSIHEEKEGDPNVWWKVEQTFSTKLFGPARFKGNFKRYTKEALTDRHGRFLLTSSWEQLRGPQVEFDNNRPFIEAEQDVLQLELPLLSSMVDTVNTSGIWGFNGRQVKLSNFDWTRHILKRNASAIGSSFTTQEASTSLSADPLLNEKQEITIQGNPTGGTFIIHWHGLTTGTIPYNASAANVQAALTVTFGANFTVTGGPFPLSPIEVEFIGTYAVSDVGLLGINTSGLTGGFKNQDIHYFTRRFEFDLDSKTFDRKILDEGTKALNGRWDTVHREGTAFGAGCRLIISASSPDGAITSAVVAGDPVSNGYLSGFGYPAGSTTTQLRVISGGGSGGIVQVTIDALGRVDFATAITIVEPGTGYTTTDQTLGLSLFTEETVQVTNDCAVDITTVNGTTGGPSPVTGVSLVPGGTSGGSGYPPDQKIRMTLTFNALPEEAVKRIPCIITATVDAAGVVTAVELVDGGDGYYPVTAGVPFFTTEPLVTVYSYDQWVLNLINGRLPDPNNPQHFERYHDREGNPSRVVLDGQGVPAKSIVFRQGSLRVSGDPAFKLVEYYPESNFLKLGLPSDPDFSQ